MAELGSGASGPVEKDDLVVRRLAFHSLHWVPWTAAVPVVAPVNVQVSFVTAQLSAVVGFGTTTLAVHTPMPLVCVMLAGQVIVGA